jgi:hypothetical protein
MYTQCPACWHYDGATLMGFLGNRAHLRCRYCGNLWSTILPDAEAPELEENDNA